MICFHWQITLLLVVGDVGDAEQLEGAEQTEGAELLEEGVRKDFTGKII
jgi:hypothetical protein